MVKNNEESSGISSKKKFIDKSNNNITREEELIEENEVIDIIDPIAQEVSGNTLFDNELPANTILDTSILDSELDIIVVSKSKKRFASAEKEVPPILKPIWKGDDIN